MKRWKKIGVWAATVLLLAFAFMVWYKETYSMKVAKGFEVNSPSDKNHLLIATQGSKFKDSVVHQLVNALKTRSLYIKIIDVSDLKTINESDWNVVVILHTWENWKPQQDVKLFVERVKDKQKLVVLATSGQGSYRIEGIDAITSASVLTDVSGKSKEIIARVERLLDERR